MRLDIMLDVIGYRMRPAFHDFSFEPPDRLGAFGGGDDTALDVFAEQIKDAFRMLLIHQDFGSGF
jgi:hypothetical protein